MNDKRIFTLNEPNAPRLNPALACEIGLNESIILLQIEYWISISDNQRDGSRWTYQSVRDMHKKSFPFWSIATINRAVNKLINEGYVIEGNYNKAKYDNTRWFALNFEKLKELKSIAIKGYDDGVFQNDTHSNKEDVEVLQNGTYPNQNETEVFQNDTGLFQNDTHSNQNETTIPEITTETITEITTHTKKEVEEVMCVLDKKITFEESKKILEVANGDIEVIKEKYEVAKMSEYRNLIGFMLKAIKEDWQIPKKQECKVPPVNNATKFHNFEHRTSKYSPEQLESMILNRSKNLVGR